VGMDIDGTMGQDLRHGMRLLNGIPVFAMIAALTLALG